MRRMVCEVQEKRPVAVALDEGQRLLSELLGEQAVAQIDPLASGRM